MDESDIARMLYEHPSFKNIKGSWDYIDNEWLRCSWIDAVITAKVAGALNEAEAFARALYEFPQWGYKQPWGRNPRVCAPWRKAAADVLGRL